MLQITPEQQKERIKIKYACLFPLSKGVSLQVVQKSLADISKRSLLVYDQPMLS